jgi:hypothetical protein
MTTEQLITDIRNIIENENRKYYHNGRVNPELLEEYYVNIQLTILGKLAEFEEINNIPEEETNHVANRE